MVTGITGAYFGISGVVGKFLFVFDTGSTGVAVSLPTAVGNNAEYVLKKVSGANTVVVSSYAGETVDGYTTTVLSGLNESKTILSTGTGMVVV